MCPTDILYAGLDWMNLVGAVFVGGLLLTSSYPLGFVKADACVDQQSDFSFTVNPRLHGVSNTKLRLS